MLKSSLPNVQTEQYKRDSEVLKSESKLFLVISLEQIELEGCDRSRFVEHEEILLDYIKFFQFG